MGLASTCGFLFLKEKWLVLEPIYINLTLKWALTVLTPSTSKQMSDLMDHLFTQFNRCITSQMIKWFSNFREFYYIQMEKYARQALSDGITNAQALAVLRDSELFRVLNTHYNKGNDFEVRHALGPMRSKMCILRMVGRWQS